MNPRLVFLDVETTGIDPQEGHKIIEIACIEVVDRIASKRTFHHYLNPERVIDKEAIRVHGITDKMVKDKPTFDTIIDPLLDFVRDVPIVAHNAEFDIGFLNVEIDSCNNRKNTSYPQVTNVCSEVIDTLSIARKKFSDRLSNSLDALCDRFGIDRTSRTHHGALLDAQLLFQVWLHLTSGQKKLDLQSEGASANKRVARVDRSQPLPIVYANEQEVAAHNAYFDNIQ